MPDVIESGLKCKLTEAPAKELKRGLTRLERVHDPSRPTLTVAGGISHRGRRSGQDSTLAKAMAASESAKSWIRHFDTERR